MSNVVKRAALVVVGLAGLTLLVLGLWLTAHLGTSGSASFTTSPAPGVVVLEPTVLNRVAGPVRVTAVARGGDPVWIGRTTPSDARAIVGNAARTTIAAARVRDWSLTHTQAGAGPAPQLDQSDVWRQSATGSGHVTMALRQADAPEAVVVATPDGSPAHLRTVTLTVEHRTWFFQALLVTLVGLIVVAAAAGALWYRRTLWYPRTPRPATSTAASA